ncbi:unnamed protein product [Brassica oleracea]|uniref:Uncharacterized protein n=2 Tax=Brassica oleracea TaxID=3712 RepID=A0A0D3B6J7_BRAOL|nr:unnamed protein product [Brassica oleracea]
MKRDHPDLLLRSCKSSKKKQMKKRLDQEQWRARYLQLKKKLRLLKLQRGWQLPSRFVRANKL